VNDYFFKSENNPFNFIQWEFNSLLNKIKPPADATDFQMNYRASSGMRDAGQLAIVARMRRSLANFFT